MLAEALRLLRVYHDMKQVELCEALSLSKSYISEIEKGNRTPSMEVIQKYADYFKIPASSILFFSEQLEQSNGSIFAKANAKNAIASKIIGFLKLIEEKAQLNET